MTTPVVHHHILALDDTLTDVVQICKLQKSPPLMPVGYIVDHILITMKLTEDFIAGSNPYENNHRFEPKTWESFVQNVRAGNVPSFAIKSYMGISVGTSRAHKPISWSTT